MATVAARRTVPMLVLLGIALTAAPARSQSLVRHLAGEADGDGFARVVSVPDVDGDGLLELFVGAPHNDDAGDGAGGAQLRSGADGSLLARWLGAGPGDAFGSAVASAGDVDGDGVPDLAVGAPGTGAMPGRVEVRSGAGGGLLLEVTGTQAGGRFGAALDTVGDWDGDGRDDLLVGAPREDHGGADSGAVYVLDGDDGQVLAVHGGDDAGDELGTSLSGSGAGSIWMADTDPEPVVGAPQPQSGGDGGYARVLARGTLAVVRTLRGDVPGAGFGRAVAHLGDLDGDGVVDTAVGTGHGPAVAGRVDVVSGADGSLLARHLADVAGTGYGAALAAVGDVNGDGVDDLAVGEADADDNGVDSGNVHVLSGADGVRLHLLRGGAAGERAGLAVAGAGDVDGDGLSDVALGAPGGASGGAATGTVAVVGVLWGHAGGGAAETTGETPVLTGHGAMTPGEDVTLVADDCPPLAPAVLVIGTALVVDPLGLAPSADVVVTGLVTDVHGHLSTTLTWPAELPADAAVYYQFQFGTSRSNTVRASK